MRYYPTQRSGPSTTSSGRKDSRLEHPVPTPMDSLVEVASMDSQGVSPAEAFLEEEEAVQPSTSEPGMRTGPSSSSSALAPPEVRY